MEAVIVTGADMDSGSGWKRRTKGKGKVNRCILVSSAAHAIDRYKRPAVKRETEWKKHGGCQVNGRGKRRTVSPSQDSLTLKQIMVELGLSLNVCRSMVITNGLMKIETTERLIHWFG